VNKLFLPGIATLFFSVFATPTYAIELLKYVGLLQTQSADGAERSTVYGIIESCGNATRLNDDCVIQGLNRVAKEENNTLAQSIANVYTSAEKEGNYTSKPECQTDDHFQANRIIGHCWLLLNYYAIQSNNDTDTAGAQYAMCLQGGLQGLVFQGNIAAQYMLAKLYDERGIAGTGEVWTNAIKMRKGTQAYELLQKCYL